MSTYIITVSKIEDFDAAKFPPPESREIFRQTLDDFNLSTWR